MPHFFAVPMGSQGNLGQMFKEILLVFLTGARRLRHSLGAAMFVMQRGAMVQVPHMCGAICIQLIVPC